MKYMTLYLDWNEMQWICITKLEELFFLYMLLSTTPGYPLFTLFSINLSSWPHNNNIHLNGTNTVPLSSGKINFEQLFHIWIISPYNVFPLNILNIIVSNFTLENS